MSETDQTPDDSVVVSDQPGRQRYEIAVDGQLAGFVQYRRQANVIDLVHTEIDPAFEGRGLGVRLARATLDDLARRGLQIIPTCPFITEYLRRHPAYVELVVADHRAAFEP